ncbi:MAG TPA: hypothetical protein VLQ45_16490 [Thermoanaerobaculia bacterium]|nr:hypothetical protein [Thermoanaerobaculia bacterium]
MRSLVALSIFVVLSLASGASAVTLEGSPEFQVNVTALGEQRFADVAIDAAGRSMAVWNSDHLGPQALTRIYGRIYGASGAPLTGEFEISDPGSSFQLKARVAASTTGFLVVWSQGNGISARRFDAGGHPLGAAFVLSTSGSQPAVEARPGGGFLVVWADDTGIRGVILDSDAIPGSVLTLVHKAGSALEPSLAVAPSGDFLVAWSMGEGYFTEDIWARLFHENGQPQQGHAFLVNGEAPYQAGYQNGSAAVFHADGSFSIVWQTVLSIGGGRLGVYGRTFVGSGQPQAGVTVLDSGVTPYSLEPLALASNPYGRLLLLWSGTGPEDEGVHGRILGPSLQPLGDPFLANVFKGEDQSEPAVAADAHGNFMAVWSSGSGYPQILPRGDEGLSSQDGNFYGVFGRRFAGCSPAAGHLCLGSGRFRVEVAWTDHDGNSGTGKARALTDDTGAFWFFEESNLELMLKVLDGRGVNGHFWVFYGALSDVAYTVTVTDTVTDVVRTYTNPSGRMASRADVQAFSDPVAPPAAAAAPARVSLPLTPPLLNCGVGPGSTELCLGERFRVSVRFVDPRTGTVGQGQPLALTADTGVFSFFDSDNLELMIKALDGGPVNGHHWIFYGALSDVEYTITVTDIFSDETRTYRNPAGTMASRGDTGAFPQ